MSPAAANGSDKTESHSNRSGKTPGRQPNSRRRPSSLAKLVKICRSAPAVWLALCELSEQRGSPVVTSTRKQLLALTGIKDEHTISRALGALKNMNWLEYERVPVLNAHGEHIASLLRLVLRGPKVGKNALTGRNAVHAQEAP